jgi:cyanophycinase
MKAERMPTRHRREPQSGKVEIDGVPSKSGTLIIIGGREDKKDGKHILTRVAQQALGGRLVICTVASTESPEELWDDYRRVFRELGMKDVAHLQIEHREGGAAEEQMKILDHTSVVFFTGGDQLRITSKLEGTAIADRIRRIYAEGGTIAGTSAGASVMSETMLVSGTGSASYRIGQDLSMAPGLGLMRDAIIDQHFAERGRLGRLLGAVAQNPRLLGIGIDEDTAIVVDPKRRCEVLGSGAVYIVDGRDVTCTNISEEHTDGTMSMFDVRLHVLSQGDVFDITTHRPTSCPARNVERHAS